MPKLRTRSAGSAHRHHRERAAAFGKGRSTSPKGKPRRPDILAAVKVQAFQIAHCVRAAFRPFHPLHRIGRKRGSHRSVRFGVVEKSLAFSDFFVDLIGKPRQRCDDALEVALIEFGLLGFE